LEGVPVEKSRAILSILLLGKLKRPRLSSMTQKAARIAWAGHMERENGSKFTFPQVDS
jgi:hypothetical protein